MHIRKYNEQDLPILQKWFSDHNWNGFDPSMIPKNAFFAVDGETPIAFSCFASTDCSIALMGYTVTNKEYLGAKGKAIDMVLAEVMAKAKESGHKYMVYYTNTAYMIPRMRKAGMKLADRHGKTYVLVNSLTGDSTEFLEE